MQAVTSANNPNSETRGASHARAMRPFWKRVLHWRYRLFQRHRHQNLVLEEVLSKSFVVLPEVFNPKLFRTGEFMAEAILTHGLPAGATALDMGTGTGIGAVFAAQFARKVVAVDINPAAVRCARINVLLNQVEEQVDVRQSELWAAVQGERFDVALFNPPYFRGEPTNALDHAWRSNTVVERFAAQLKDHLTPDGYAWVVLSDDGDSAAFLNTFGTNSLHVQTVVTRAYLNETLTVYQLSLDTKA